MDGIFIILLYEISQNFKYYTRRILVYENRKQTVAEPTQHGRTYRAYVCVNVCEFLLFVSKIKNFHK
jgi:hypothetical protein